MLTNDSLTSQGDPLLWKLIDQSLALDRPILGGWYTRGSWRYGVCTFDVQTSSWYSDRGAVPSHYLTVLPIEAPAPANAVPEAISGPVVLDASPDPMVTDWDGDPTGPPVV